MLSPITHDAILQWSVSYGMTLSPWEIMALGRIDDLYLDAQRKAAQAAASKNNKT